MNKLTYISLAAPALAAALLASCTHSEIVIKQDKPLEINLNVNANVNLVITDARQDMEQITGEKPKQTVSLEDIGLPPASSPPAAPSTPAPSGAGHTMATPPAAGIITLADFGPPAASPLASEDDLKKSMAARDKEVRALWNDGLVGEAHTGLLVEKGVLTAAQQKLISAENADRTQLYKIQAAAKGTSEADVALAFYLSRLGYAQKGCWYETYDKAAKAWVWAKWDR